MRKLVLMLLLTASSTLSLGKTLDLSTVLMFEHPNVIARQNTWASHPQQF